MLDAKKEVKEDLYYSADTHRNQIGGYVGASCLLKELGIETKSLKDHWIIIHRWLIVNWLPT